MITIISERAVGVRPWLGVDWPILTRLEKHATFSKKEWVVLSELCQGAPAVSAVFRRAAEAAAYYDARVPSTVITRARPESRWWLCAARCKHQPQALLDVLERGTATMTATEADVFMPWARTIPGWHDAAPPFTSIETWR